MRECICGQCAENLEQARHWASSYVSCDSCNLYGHEQDDFDGQQSAVCNDCAISNEETDRKEIL